MQHEYTNSTAVPAREIGDTALNNGSSSLTVSEYVHQSTFPSLCSYHSAHQTAHIYHTHREARIIYLGSIFSPEKSDRVSKRYKSLLLRVNDNYIAKKFLGRGRKLVSIVGMVVSLCGSNESRIGGGSVFAAW